MKYAPLLSPGNSLSQANFSILFSRPFVIFTELKAQQRAASAIFVYTQLTNHMPRIPRICNTSFATRQVDHARGNTRNNWFQFAIQQCGETSWRKMLPVLPDLYQQRKRWRHQNTPITRLILNAHHFIFFHPFRFSSFALFLSVVSYLWVCFKICKIKRDDI